ncbi:LLM class flavin-dependent oxidoreductase [Aeromicrobium camelliae]|uniref:LLM class flavin-dependent oxidoreductase n=1 Tax=Aeromicrobium camelliae TaxID=1538144 RepID=A0A3N6X484_9ACTN|nr:LLM class flavin-dependent oxidoreductase [Aeromicrobium camelliae]RQN08925.1 LLM class flavin-dependent oxidoreductase [Aeromicrobium camelliae]
MPLTFGLAIMNDFPPDVVPADRIAAMREQVRAASQSGISSAWVLQHYLGGMPTLQPVPTLAALAADAGEMQLGTNMFILPLRHPVEVAEEFSTLDHITGGRAVAGFGMGYRENEFASFGIGLDERVGRFEESIAMIRDLWSGEPVTRDGEYYRIEDQSISLRPVQPGGPEIWIGAGPHKKGAQRAARLGDAWIVPPHVEPERLKVVLGHYRAEKERLGLPVKHLVVRRELVLDRDRERARAIGLQARGDVTAQYAQYNAPQQGDAYRHLQSAQSATDVADASYLFTDPEGAIAALKELEAQGLTYIILRMQWYGLPQEQVLATLDMFKNDVLPAFR